MGRACEGAWEDTGNTCTVLHDMTCDQELAGSSDAICQCSAEVVFEENPDAVIAVAGPPVSVLIDSSTDKCVTASVAVICADDAGHLGNRINTHQAGGTLEITVNGDEVCARRTDSGGGWGMHLEFPCVAAPVHILIDSSGEHQKRHTCFPSVLRW